jgi:glyoxylase-like metal-dependent hydrolase (beta-lactamase superfamily II)
MKELGEGIVVETGFDGVNVGAVRTSEGIICIDAPSYPRETREWIFRLENHFSSPVLLLILTDFHGDRILNTRWFNAPVITHSLVAERINSYRRRYPQNLIDSLRRRNPIAARELMHSPVHRPSMSFTKSLFLGFPPYTIELSHNPGPTPANTWVTIREENILFTGDSLVSGTIPNLSDFQWRSWMSSLKLLASDLSSYRYLVPGRGELTDRSLVETMIDYLASIEESVLSFSKSGLSSLDLSDSVEDLIRKMPNDSMPRDWIVDELTIGLKRAYKQLYIEAENRIIEEPDDQYV